MSGVDEPSYLAACLGKLDHGEPELASALIARGAERLNANGRGANTRVFKLFGQLCALETTLLRASTTLGIDRRSTSARGLFTFTRKSLLDEYQGLWAALADSAKAFAAVGSAMLPMIEAAAALVSTRTRVASHYAKLGGAFGGGLPPPMDAVDDIASSAQASAGMLEPHRLLLPQICEDIASELGLLRRLLRLRTTLGRCEPLESALLARESQRALIMWRSRAIKRALQDLPTLERDAQGVDVELFQICMNSLPDPPIPTLSRDQMFGLRCESVTRDFQMDNGLPVDGKVNVATWKELFATLTEQWPRPHWGTMHPKTASAASYVAQIASDAATHGGPVPATDGSGPWAAGSLQRGPFLPPAALWLHDLWLRLCEKMSLYFDEMRRLGRQHLLPAITAPLERSSSGHSNSSKHAMSQPSSPQSASIRSGAPRLSTSTVPSTSMAGSSENDDTIPSLDRKESTADQPDGSGHRIGAVTSLPSVHPRDFAEGEAKHAAISAHTLGMQDRDSPEERPGTPERTGGLKQASRSQLVWEAPSRFEHRIMELCGGSVIPRQGRAQSSSSLADQEWTIGAMASGLTMQAEGERGAALSTDRPLNVRLLARRVPLVEFSLFSPSSLWLAVALKPLCYAHVRVANAEQSDSRCPTCVCGVFYNRFERSWSAAETCGRDGVRWQG